MDLEAYLVEKTELVNKALKELLAGETEYPQDLHRAMHYSLFAGGKRLRPVLAIAAAEAVGGPAGDVLNVACALECIHTYSLIHDDLPAIDNDDLRRGRPTCHKVFGEAIAILAGDALLTASFEIMARSSSRDKGALLKAFSEIARAAGSMGMIGGQAVDIESEGKEITLPILQYIHIHKTGELILASIRAGALISGADEAGLKALTRYGESVGLAFQITDDILDVEGTEAVLGKPVGGDKKKGKATYPALLGLDEAKRRAGELTVRAVDALSGFDGKADPLRAIAMYITGRVK